MEASVPGLVSPGLLILIPARGGSKQVPGKNIRPLGGVPLLAWTARAIAASGVEARPVLSTDDPATAEIGRAYGLEVSFLRPAELATDTSGMMGVVDHAVGWVEGQGGFEVSAIMLLQPTSPFRKPRRLNEALELLARPGTDGVVGVRAIARRLSVVYHESAGGLLEPLEVWNGESRRQDVRPLLTPNGTLYLVTRASLTRHRSLFPPRLRALHTDAIEGIDIDTPEDWKLAEAIAAAGLATP